VKRRLLTSMALVTALAVALFGVPLGLVVGRIYRSREVSRLQQQATEAAGALPAGVHGASAHILPQPAKRNQIGIYDTSNHLVAGTGPAVASGEVLAALGGNVANARHGGWLGAAVPIRDDERIIGAARAAVPWKVVSDETERTWLVMAVFGALALTIAGGVAWWQASRLAAPVADVAALATRLGDGDFSGQLEPSGIPEIDRANDALNRTASRLGDLIARERAFTSDVSHQLNTPLTSLRLELESALVTPGVDLAASIDSALAEVDRLQTTVATLLAVARDTMRAGTVTCDVAEVCDRVASRHRAGLAAVGRRLYIDIEPELPPALCPSDVLAEILTVLLDNAKIHGSGTVTIAARRSGPGVVVDVTDEGGKRIADPAVVFRRRAPEAAGHGIGLALARSLAEAHEARLELTRTTPAPVFTVALAGASRSAPAG
jgi:signal transduction histidine kinase